MHAPVVILTHPVHGTCRASDWQIAEFRAAGWQTEEDIAAAAEAKAKADAEAKATDAPTDPPATEPAPIPKAKKSKSDA